MTEKIKNNTTAYGEAPIKFIVVGFDGLRPDYVKPDEMPALSKFVSESHHWTDYLACFPTETYVNHPSIFSGFRPNRHGIIANCFYNASPEAKTPDEKLFAGWSVASVMANDRLAGGLYQVPDLGERLARDGKRLRVLCANSPGSTRLQHVHAEGCDGHLNCCVHAVHSTLPTSEAKALAKEYGDGVPLQFPDKRGTDLLAELFFKREAVNGAAGLADVTVLWIGEPDHSQHEFGLDDPRTVEARRHADATFARILAWWEENGRDANVQLVVMSDHGHGEVVRHVDPKAILERAGFNVATGDDIREGRDVSHADIVMVGTYATGLWLRNKTPKMLAAVRDVLMASPEIGLVFSQPALSRPNEDLAAVDPVEGRVPGTFSEALVFSDSERGPDLRFVTRGERSTGKLVMAEELAIGAGNHGGLNPQETHSLLAIAGSRFPGYGEHQEPTSHDDVAMTMMTMLGLLDDEAAAPMPTGRILGEAFRPLTNDPIVKERLTLGCGRFEQEIVRLVYKGHAYVIEAGRIDNDGWTAEKGIVR